MFLNIRQGKCVVDNSAIFPVFFNIKVYLYNLSITDKVLTIFFYFGITISCKLSTFFLLNFRYNT